jgi:hypothetical protein
MTEQRLQVFPCSAGEVTAVSTLAMGVISNICSVFFGMLGSPFNLTGSVNLRVFDPVFSSGSAYFLAVLSIVISLRSPHFFAVSYVIFSIRGPSI